MVRDGLWYLSDDHFTRSRGYGTITFRLLVECVFYNSMLWFI